MRVAIIEDGIVQLVTEVNDPMWVPPFGITVEISDKTIGPHWTWDGKDFFPPVMAPEPPTEMEKLLDILITKGTISPGEKELILSKTAP